VLSYARGATGSGEQETHLPLKRAPPILKLRAAFLEALAPRARFESGSRRLVCGCSKRQFPWLVGAFRAASDGVARARRALELTAVARALRRIQRVKRRAEIAMALVALGDTISRVSRAEPPAGQRLA
jgi:hypothetical protein